MYRLICFNGRGQVTWYRWYIQPGYVNVAQALLQLRKKREVASFSLDEFDDKLDHWAIRLEDEKKFGISTCKQCLCSHSNGNARFCEPCLLHPYPLFKKRISKELDFVKAKYLNNIEYCKKVGGRTAGGK